ncbi:tetratricopeptide repeat protein [Catellatospora tritici]|uniref:tetratricopeptide repeat protein n=1 Tax=Catellatospora tritici TaxID=2851566 RepID=UPI001C2D24B0|nr:tetratricopeptide repeat protein [Catellatospora tritici]MBV1854535.1 tetratricopeptide repeat protein [Catellatospora tritici]
MVALLAPPIVGLWLDDVRARRAEADRKRSVLKELSGTPDGVWRTVAEVAAEAAAKTSAAVRLGIHQAIPLDETAYPRLPRGLPTYIGRDADTQLHGAVSACIDRGGFVLLVGESAVGKTRSALEALRELVPAWRFFRPSSPQAIRKLVDAGVDRGKLIVWLDDIRRYLIGEDAIAPETLRDLLLGTSGTIVIGAIWPAHLARLTAPAVDLGGDSFATARDVLRMADFTIHVPASFTTEEANRASRSVDPRLIEAAAVAADGRLLQALASTPALVGKWTDGIDPTLGASPSGVAVLQAAVAGTLLELPQPLSPSWIQQVAAAWLSPQQRASAAVDWFDQGVMWACAPVRGEVAAMYPVSATVGRIDGYHVADAIVFHADSVEPTLGWPKAVVEAIAAQGSPQTCAQIGDAAHELGFDDIAERLWRQGGDAGDTESAHRLGWLSRERGELAEAERWWTKAAQQGHPHATMFLYDLLRAAGREHEAAQWLQVGIAREDAPALADRAAELMQDGRDDEAEAWYRRAAMAGDRDSMYIFAHLQKDKNPAEAERWFGEAARLGETDAMIALADILEHTGRLEEAIKTLRDAVRQDEPHAMVRLSFLLRRTGDPQGESEALIRKASDLGDSWAMTLWAGRMYTEGEEEAAEQLLRRSADLGEKFAHLKLGELLRDRGDHAAAAVEYQAAADYLDANDIDSLTDSLSELSRADEAHAWVTALAEAGNTAAMIYLWKHPHQAGPSQSLDHWLDQALNVLRTQAQAGEAIPTRSLIDLLSQARRYAEAIDWARTAIADGHAEHESALARLLHITGNIREAITHYQTAGSMKSPGTTRVDVYDAENGFVEAGLLLEELGQRTDAADSYRRAADQGNAYAMYLLALLEEEDHRSVTARVWLHRGRAATRWIGIDALVYRKPISTPPGVWLLLSNLPRVFRQAANVHPAVALMILRYAALRRDGTAMICIGLHHYQNGRQARAERSWRNAISEGNYSAAFFLAKILIERGNLAEARDLLQDGVDAENIQVLRLAYSIQRQAELAQPEATERVASAEPHGSM